MLVKIISGTYGHRPILPNGKKSTYLNPVRAGQPPIEVEEAEGKRLIGLGVAAEVKMENPSSETPNAPQAPSEGSNEAPEDDLESLSFNELKEYAQKIGIDAGKFRSKASLIEAIQDAVSADPGDDLPDLDAEDVVD